MKKVLLAVTLIFIGFYTFSQSKKEKQNKQSINYDASTVSSLSFRLVGPALTSGRIADIAVDQKNKDTWFIAAASGGVWKTINHGTTFSPIFDNYRSYSTSCVEIAPSNSSTIWVGTGENNNQRSVAYGDGVYKSLDGGKTFTNMGLEKSEHIGNIIIHPSDENTVWVAAYGPLWKEGGERGVYKSTDGGKTWNRTLFISDETGIAEIAIDPTNPSVLYASAHQRRRHEWTYIGGGPESGVYKSTDGGISWRKINNGLPENEMGRIGIAVSPVDPSLVYAIIEAKYGKGGFYRSTNKGESWTKMSDFSTSGNYYQEIVCDPFNKDKVFAMDTYMHHTENGGKTFQPTGEHQKHVDNHALWIDPSNPNHWLAGCDGGIYETYNSAEQWKFYSNLPIIQFYKVVTDNAWPFYNIYGGTQDNNSMGGPSATSNVSGILNSDWFITNGGDGFESATDPTDPNITYAQAQYGWLVRHDKASGEKVYIQPLPQKGEPAYRWNWDAPLLVSPHDHKTLYFAANKVFKSTNRGDDWTTISSDLTKQIDRNKLEVMGQIWSIDAIMKNASTTVYGNIIALDESPVKKGLLYAGTDDGLIQISENDGKNWTKISDFMGVPSNTRVNMLTASLHDENTVFAAFNNQRMGDFKPYLMKSTDKGKTWTSINGNLPERGTTYCIKQDHINPDLLFVGTEFGAYFTTDGGQNWIKLSGLPTIAVYDLDIQKRENDLVAATFGRGFYVLDNYSPLRELSEETMNKNAHLFPIKDALLYVQADPLGLEGTGFQGANLWSSSNPAFGATFSYYLKQQSQTLKEIRQDKESNAEKKKEDVFYPSFEDLNKERFDEEMKLLFIIKDSTNTEVKRLITPASKGINRVVWNLRKESTNPINPSTDPNKSSSFLVAPGSYTVEIYSVKNGEIIQLISPNKFNVRALRKQTLHVKNPQELDAFRSEMNEINRQIIGSSNLLDEMKEATQLYEHAILTYPNVNTNLLSEIRTIKLNLYDCEVMMQGDRIRTKYEFEALPGIAERMWLISHMVNDNSLDVTNNQRTNLALIKEEYDKFKSKLEELLKKILSIEDSLITNKIPYTKQMRGWKLD